VYTNPGVKSIATPAAAAQTMAGIPNAIGYVPIANALVSEKKK